MLTEDQVLDGLSAMRLAGLNDFGRWPSNGAGLSAMVKVWHSRLEANRVTPEEFSARTAQCLDRMKDFPSVADFLRGIDRPSAAVILDPVIVHELGEDRLGSRHHAVRSGLPYREVSEPTPALPSNRPPPEPKVRRMESLPGPTEEARRNLQRQIDQAKERTA